jgi:hypothetical protein
MKTLLSALIALSVLAGIAAVSTAEARITSNGPQLNGRIVPVDQAALDTVILPSGESVDLR